MGLSDMFKNTKTNATTTPDNHWAMPKNGAVHTANNQPLTTKPQEVETIDLNTNTTSGYTYTVGGQNLSEINVNKDVKIYQSPETLQYIKSEDYAGLMDKDIQRLQNNEITLEELMYEIEHDTDPTRRKQLMKTFYTNSLCLTADELNEYELKYRSLQIQIDNLSKQAQFTADITIRAELETKIAQLNNEAAPYKAKLDNNRYLKQYIDNKMNYYIKNVDSYTHKEDFDQNKSMNIAALNTYNNIKAGNSVNSKEEYYTSLLSAILNNKADVKIDASGNTYIEGINHPIKGDSHFNFYLECANRNLLTSEEIDVFNYIYNTEGSEAAYNYLEKNYYEYDNRWLASKTQEDKAFAQEHEVIASMSSIILSPFEGMGGVVMSISSLAKDEKIARHDVYSRSDVYRSGVSSEISDSGHTKLAFVYDTGMSMADTGVLIATNVLSGGLGAIGQAASSAAIMGSKAYTSTLNDALDRGLTDEKAVLLASASGITETAMESYSLGHLMNLEGKMGAKILEKGAIIEATKGQTAAKLFYGLSGILSQGIAEAEEEAATEIINYYSDQFISGDLSSYNLEIDSYLQNGDTLDVAINKANASSVKQVGLAALGGLLSGFGFGAGKSTKTNYSISKDMARGIINEYDMYATNPNSVSSRMESRQIYEQMQEENLNEATKQNIQDKLGKLKTWKENMQSILNEKTNSTKEDIEQLRISFLREIVVEKVNKIRYGDVNVEFSKYETKALAQLIADEKGIYRESYGNDLTNYPYELRSFIYNNNELLDEILKLDGNYFRQIPQTSDRLKIAVSNADPSKQFNIVGNVNLNVDSSLLTPEIVDIAIKNEGESVIEQVIEETLSNYMRYSTIPNYVTPSLIKYILASLNNFAGFYPDFVYNMALSMYGKFEDTDTIDKGILCGIYNGSKYDESVPASFKEKNPTLFLEKNINEDIRNKFYNKEFTIDDFNSNPELLNSFKNTNIAFGINDGKYYDFTWLRILFNDYSNQQEANEYRLKLANEYLSISNYNQRKQFKEYFIEYGDTTTIEDVDKILKVINRLAVSNSSEMRVHRFALINQIIKTKNYMENLNAIEEVFIKNNLPTIGKIYSCFDILHPDFKGFDFESESSTISPVLKEASTTGKKIITFSDLIKSTFGSNNRSVNLYLKNVEIGSKLYEGIRNGSIDYNSLSNVDKEELDTFSKHLLTLYNNTMKAKIRNDRFVSTGNTVADISELTNRLSPDSTQDYNLADRVIRMFCGFSGINTLEEAQNYVNQKVKTADARNREAAKHDMTLEQGDFIKGIGGIEYLGKILQNGSNAREYLGESAGSDRTPLDTDMSIILSNDGTFADKMNNTLAVKKLYGPIFFVLKGDDRFNITRTQDGTISTKNDPSKLEAFYTGAIGADHYGIRTGFASSDINYIIMEKYDPRVGLEIALNGFYIPVVNNQGKVVFTPDDYEDIRSKMHGLSRFDETNYEISSNLATNEILEMSKNIGNNEIEASKTRQFITNAVKRAMSRISEYGNGGLEVRESISNDLEEGYVELIDTGSTGRGTNVPLDGDFDFMMKLDQKIMLKPDLLEQVKDEIKKEFISVKEADIADGNFRYKGVKIEDLDKEVDIDITFGVKTDKVQYSTDMCVRDRLNSIKEQYPDKYNLVLANIIKAKEILKDGKCYKAYRSDKAQGGLGGVGVENWILQNGGSLEDAARSFLEAAEGKSFEEFKKEYTIYDFGENHLAEAKGIYSHDNFVENNMSEDGYKKMIEVLKEYLNNPSNSIIIDNNSMTEEKRQYLNNKDKLEELMILKKQGNQSLELDEQIDKLRGEIVEYELNQTENLSEVVEAVKKVEDPNFLEEQLDDYKNNKDYQFRIYKLDENLLDFFEPLAKENNNIRFKVEDEKITYTYDELKSLIGNLKNSTMRMARYSLKEALKTPEFEGLFNMHSVDSLLDEVMIFDTYEDFINEMAKRDGVTPEKLMETYKEKGGTVGGVYYNNSDYDKKLLLPPTISKHELIHEMLHGLTNIDGKVGIKEEYEIVDYSAKPPKTYKMRPNAMNEGYTEYLARKISGVSYTGEGGYNEVVAKIEKLAKAMEVITGRNDVIAYEYFHNDPSITREAFEKYLGEGEYNKFVEYFTLGSKIDNPFNYGQKMIADFSKLSSKIIEHLQFAFEQERAKMTGESPSTYNVGKVVNTEDIVDYKQAAKDFSEGNIALEKLLLNCFENKIETLASCAGHPGKFDPYIAFATNESSYSTIKNIINNLDYSEYCIGYINNSETENAKSIFGINMNGALRGNLEYDPQKSTEMFTHINEIIGNKGTSNMPTPDGMIMAQLIESLEEENNINLNSIELISEEQRVVKILNEPDRVINEYKMEIVFNEDSIDAADLYDLGFDLGEYSNSYVINTASPNRINTILEWLINRNSKGSE